MSTNKSGMSTDPAINEQVVSVRNGRHSGDAMVSVQDTERATVEVSHQDEGFGHPVCTCNVIAGTEKLVATVRDICDFCMKADTGVVLDEHGDDLMRDWVERSAREGHFVPFPRELANRLDTLMIECVGPKLIAG
jgi:hypothetical protein